MTELPSWSLCIATMNRADALEITVRLAAAQDSPPAQIVIVDASDDWKVSRTRLLVALSDHPDIAFDHVAADVRSSATQRNQGIALCCHDIVFLLDDDSFLHPGAAREILTVYAADPDHTVAAVAARLVPDVPPLPGAATNAPLERKNAGAARDVRGLRSRVRSVAAGRWIARHVLMESVKELFFHYDGPRIHPLSPALARLDVFRQSTSTGCALTARRPVALAEPFDTALRYYAASEDVDATYRYASHGHLLQARLARLHHFEVTGGRIARGKVIAFQLLNLVVFLKKHAADPDRWKWPYRVMLARRLLGETLKDLLSKRWSLPQVRGVLIAMRHWDEVWNRTPVELDAWYPAFQKMLIEKM